MLLVNIVGRKLVVQKSTFVIFRQVIIIVTWRLQRKYDIKNKTLENWCLTIMLMLILFLVKTNFPKWKLRMFKTAIQHFSFYTKIVYFAWNPFSFFDLLINYLTIQNFSHWAIFMKLVGEYPNSSWSTL